jgi:hypothetical protein
MSVRRVTRPRLPVRPWYRRIIVQSKTSKNSVSELPDSESLAKCESYPYLRGKYQLVNMLLNEILSSTSRSSSLIWP